MAEATAGKTCPKCGYKRAASETVPDWQCPKCGVAYAKATAATAPTEQPAARTVYTAQRRMAASGPIEAVIAGLKGYFNFSGRATRGEFWWFFLFFLIVSVGAVFVDKERGPILTLVFILPYITVLVRRLHDVGRSGWWYWIGLVPIIGPLLLLWWAVQPSDGDNDYGSASS